MADEQRFRTTIAAVQAADSVWVGRLAKPIRRSTVAAWAVAAVCAWATMSVLMVWFGWAGVVVTCVVAGLVLTVVQCRR
ncbi:hypothetical protein DMB66_50100 [Actinoplanes sp. ATCC 53533]|uniref:hypothetical protein n=1 Tax=Actinoplanes sp. ATCC 53533 TaxID=1288362 RepID=UPI000F7B77F4|nr:hypothetical protein [Actinoplanes sp. ATCC 53533]RSM46180.1 hypothetical protein DMB66_50100 [Actinoplanes sp. ATCC 53533]